jgi:hypothetical protein
MSESNQSIELLRNTLKQLEIILRDLEGNLTDNPQVLNELKSLANTTQKLVVNLQDIETTKQVAIAEDEDFFIPEVNSESEIVTREKNKFSRFLIPGIVTLIVVSLVAVWYFVLPQTDLKIAHKIPVIEQPQGEIEITSEIPPELTTPELPQKVETITPELKLTPEQGLVVAIKNQIATIKNRYAEDLVIGIEPNFMASRLIVKVSNNWYELETSNQTSIADDIFREAQKLDFKKLEITNLQGQLVARSPVVGNNMIILQNN